MADVNVEVKRPKSASGKWIVQHEMITSINPATRFMHRRGDIVSPDEFGTYPDSMDPKKTYSIFDRLVDLGALVPYNDDAEVGTNVGGEPALVGLVSAPVGPADQLNRPAVSGSDNGAPPQPTNTGPTTGDTDKAKK